MTSLAQGLAEQFISFFEDPNPHKLDTLLRILPALISDQREREAAAHVLEAHLSFHNSEKPHLSEPSPAS